MKIFIVPDLEGVSGVVKFRQDLQKIGTYDAMCKRMVKEINACIDGITEAEKDAEIFVMETHEIDDDMLSSKISGLIRGCRIPPFDSSYNLLFFVGQHAKSQEEKGILAHTGCARIMDVKINDTSYGELGIVSLLAGKYGISTCFVSGDEACVNEAKELFNNVVTVSSKIGLGMHAGVCYHTLEVLKRIKEGARLAIDKYKENPKIFQPLKVSSPYKIEVEWQYIEMADRATLIPGVKKVSKRVTVFQSEDFEEIYRCYVAQATIALIGYV